MLFCSNSITSHHIATNFCTWHDSIAVVSCAKFVATTLLESRGAKQNFYRILWHFLVKLPRRVWFPENNSTCLTCIVGRADVVSFAFTLPWESMACLTKHKDGINLNRDLIHFDFHSIDILNLFESLTLSSSLLMSQQLWRHTFSSQPFEAILRNPYLNIHYHGVTIAWLFHI